MYPALLLLQGLSASRDYNLRRAAGYLQQAAAAFAAAGDLVGRGAALLYLSDCQRSIGEFEAAHASLQQALATPLPPRQRLNALISRAYEAVVLGDGPQAIVSQEEALTLTATTDDRWLRYELAINAHSLLVVLPGGIDWAERLSRVAQSWPTPPISPLRAALFWISGFSSLLRGDPARAAAQIGQAMDIGEQLGGINKLSIDAGLYQAVVLALCGDLDGADRRFAALRTLLDQAALAAFTQSWGALHYYCVGWLRWQQGRLDEARAIVREMDATASPAEWPTAPLRQAAAARAGRVRRRRRAAGRDLAPGGSGRAAALRRRADAGGCAHAAGLQRPARQPARSCACVCPPPPLMRRYSAGRQACS